MTYEEEKKKFPQRPPELNVLHCNFNFETFKMSIFMIDCC